MSAKETMANRPKGNIPNHHSSLHAALFFRRGAMRRLTMDMSLIKMLRAGPDVSLKGSPTVSPMMQALPWSVFLIFSFSHNFLELSQAPPALDIVTANIAPETIEPPKRPIKHCGPTVK